MVASKKTHIIYRSIFLVFALVGIIGSFGTFNGAYNPDFYLYFTNISLYLSFFVSITLLLDDVKKWKNNEKQALSSLAPNFRLSVFVMVFVTFVVYNTMLSNPFSEAYWTNFQSLITHLVCPLLFMLDYLLFSKHRTLEIYAPFVALIMPFIYVFYILVRAEVYVGTGKMVYPYFFLNVYKLGWGNVVLYLLGIAVAVLLIGYAIWAYDKLVKGEDKKLKFDFSPLPKPEPDIVEENNNVEDNKEEMVENIEANQTVEVKEEKVEQIDNEPEAIKVEEKPKVTRKKVAKENIQSEKIQKKTTRKTTTKSVSEQIADKKQTGTKKTNSKTTTAKKQSSKKITDKQNKVTQNKEIKVEE